MNKESLEYQKQQNEKKETIKVSHAIKICVCWCGVVIALALFTFHIEDMTWARKETEGYNQGWYIENSTSNQELENQVITLPYRVNVPAREKFTIARQLDEKDCGKTISFLSADVFLRVFVDDEQIYEFGYEDERWFGHTPGSLLNFIDIPANSDGKILRIEIMSPYENYAGNIKDMIIGNRDICMLHYIRTNAVNILICLLTFFGAGFLFVLFLILKFSHQNTHSVEYLSFFAAICGTYYLIETKILTLIYGNQTLYSILIFLLLMLMPVFLSQYYKNTFFRHIGKQLDILQKCIIANSGTQIILQLLNVADFMDMAFISHIIIGVNLMLIFYGFARVPRNMRTYEYLYELVGTTCFMLGSTIDLIRTIVGQTGDLGKYSRFGAMVFIFTMIVVHIRYMIVDYTSRLQETANLLQVEKEAAIQADRAKSNFLANMSHEIRTPINAVLGMDEMILRESNEETVLEYASDIESAGKSLLALINDILDFSKIESGKMELVNVDYQLSSVIGDVMNMISEKAEKKGLKLNLNVNEEIPNLLHGDEVRIRQIILNILNNAVKYTDAGSVQLTVDYKKMDNNGINKNINIDHEVEMEQSNTNQVINLIIRITDTGRGIKKKDLDHLFDSFTRMDSEKNCSVEGTGLGLSIVRSFVDMMDGEIHVDSVYGEGSTFEITFSQQVISMEPIGNLQENKRRTRNRATQYHEAFIAPEVRILVVDDNEMNLKVVVGLLKNTRIQIDTASGGKIAIEKVKKSNYHMILLDHMMPEMDGMETLAELQSKNLVMKTPVVALTANAISGAREQYLTAGFQDYLSKPISGEQLEKMLMKWLPKELVQMKNVTKEENSDATEIETKYSKLQQIPKINLEQALKYSGDGKEGVIYNIELYLQQTEQSLDELEQNLHTDDLDNYKIRVHALKSNLAQIGAISESELAKNLEDAGKQMNWMFIKTHHEDMMKSVRMLNEQLKMIFGHGEKKKQEIQENQLQKLLGELIELTENYDTVGMENVKEQLEQLSVSEIEPIIQAINNLDFDEVLRLAKGYSV